MKFVFRIVFGEPIEISAVPIVLRLDFENKPVIELSVDDLGLLGGAVTVLKLKTKLVHIKLQKTTYIMKFPFQSWGEYLQKLVWS